MNAQTATKYPQQNYIYSNCAWQYKDFEQFINTWAQDLFYYASLDMTFEEKAQRLEDYSHQFCVNCNSEGERVIVRSGSFEGIAVCDHCFDELGGF